MSIHSSSWKFNIVEGYYHGISKENMFFFLDNWSDPVWTYGLLRWLSGKESAFRRHGV